MQTFLIYISFIIKIIIIILLIAILYKIIVLGDLPAEIIEKYEKLNKYSQTIDKKNIDTLILEATLIADTALRSSNNINDQSQLADVDNNITNAMISAKKVYDYYLKLFKITEPTTISVTKYSEPDEPPQFLQPVQSLDPTQPSQPDEPSQTLQPVQSLDPTQPPQLVQPLQPNEELVDEAEQQTTEEQSQQPEQQAPQPQSAQEQQPEQQTLLSSSNSPQPYERTNTYSVLDIRQNTNFDGPPQILQIGNALVNSKSSQENIDINAPSQILQAGNALVYSGS